MLNIPNIVPFSELLIPSRNTCLQQSHGGHHLQFALVMFFLPLTNANTHTHGGYHLQLALVVFSYAN